MDLKHAIVQELKRIASEIGSTPSRNDYRERSTISERKLRETFGSYSVALTAAGLDPVKKAKPPHPFLRDIRVEIQNVKKSPFTVASDAVSESIDKRIAVVGDLHFPFVNTETLTAFYAFLEKNVPDVIVQVGDLYDMYSHAKFPRSNNVYIPEEELRLGREMAVSFWDTVKRLAPRAECYQLLGNHDVRPFKRILESYPEGAIFFHPNEIFKFDGVKTILDPRTELVINGTAFLHGYRSGLGDHRDYMLMNAVCGHTHKGGVSYRQINGNVLWELNAGFMGDPNSKALGYTPQKITTWTQGWGWIDEWGPRFIHA